MTLHGRADEVGVRDLHDRLSEHLDRVERGSEIVVTRRGKPIARLSAIDGTDPLDDLVRRGLVQPPQVARRSRRPRVRPKGSVSSLVGDQRR
jgi:prevent-host-death family protein